MCTQSRLGLETSILALGTKKRVSDLNVNTDANHLRKRAAN